MQDGRKFGRELDGPQEQGSPGPHRPREGRLRLHPGGPLRHRPQASGYPDTSPGPAQDEEPTSVLLQATHVWRVQIAKLPQQRELSGQLQFVTATTTTTTALFSRAAIGGLATTFFCTTTRSQPSPQLTGHSSANPGGSSAAEPAPSSQAAVL